MQTLEQYEPFTINSCGVVLNPIIVGAEYGRYGFISCAFKCGEINGRWYAGINFENDDYLGGGASPVCASRHGGYDTATDALLAEIAKVERWNLAGRKRLQKSIDKAKEEIDNFLHPMQLTLF